MLKTYQYKGRHRNKQGLMEGECQSMTLEAAIDQLTGQGIVLTDIRAKSVNVKAFLTQSMNASVSTPELVIFTRQMYSLVKAGISIAVAIRQIGSAVQNPLLSQALQGIEQTLLAGKSLATGLANYPKIFPPIFIELVQVGEESGYLEEAFVQVSNYLLLEYNTAKQFKSAIRYPLIVLVAIIGTILIMNFFVVPSFARLYGSFHTQLPFVTRCMISSSAFFVKQWPYLLLGIVLLWWSCRYYRKTPVGRINWDRLKLRLPVIGSLLERIIVSRFARTLMIIFKAGVPLNHGMTLLSNAVGNEYVKQHVLTMQRLISTGTSLSQAAANSTKVNPD